MHNLKNKNEYIYSKTDPENKVVFTMRREKEGRASQGNGIKRCKLLHMK